MEFIYMFSDKVISSILPSKYILVIKNKKISLHESYFVQDRLRDDARKCIEIQIHTYHPNPRELINTYCICSKTGEKRRYVRQYGTIYTYLFKPVIQITRNKHEQKPTI